MSNGAIRISNLSRTNSGEYTLEVFDSEGRNKGHRTLQLFVQDKGFAVKAEMLLILVVGLIGLLCVVAMAITFICAKRKKHDEVEVDDQELSYTDVSVVQQRRRSGVKCRGRSGVQ
ncbi:hypothetical protein ATANTOWER_008578 [Ataeniobius toweri]|uniref:Uncharacterized protein n=1 Tax=Ataeniobius toweri TaxID=208326 RepID=A0ABU7BHJ9_9TELE|nr:hypothetical protein [Ataeniobius toweri]